MDTGEISSSSTTSTLSLTLQNLFDTSDINDLRLQNVIQDDDNNGFNSQSSSIPSSLDSHVSADTPSPSLISGEIFSHTPNLNMDNKQPIEPPPQLNKPRQLVRAYETQIIDSSVEKVNNVEKSKEDTLRHQKSKHVKPSCLKYYIRIHT